MSVKYFYTNIFSRVEQTYIKEIVIYRTKIDAGQKNMHIIMSLSKEKYQKTSLGRWGSPDMSSNAKKQYVYTGGWSRDGLQRCENIVWPCRDGVRKAKTQMEWRLSRDVTSNKVSFCHYIDSKRLSKENVGLLLNNASDLVTTDTGLAVELSAAFSSVFTKKVSQTSVLRQVIQGGGELPASENQVRDCMRELSPDKSMAPNGLQPRVLRELPHVLRRPLSNIFERSQGRSPMTEQKQVLHPTSKRAKRIIWGTADRLASLWLLGNLNQTKS